MATKSAQISFLVAQLKDNKITKQELFEKLQLLQQGVNVVGSDAVSYSLGRAADWVIMMRR